MRFASDPPTTADREVQSLHDRDGRIVGWFSWAPDRALARIMNELWVLAGLAGAAVAGCAFVAAHAGHRLGRLLARSIETARRLTDEDALTALPNHRAMLQRLAGREHTVITAICLRHPGGVQVDSTATRVRFTPLTGAEIDAYVATGEPLDKAGAYAIQGLASKFVEHIEGCYFNVIGLPLSQVYRYLKSLGKSVG